jgi:DnaD/phage-associated family protein
MKINYQILLKPLSSCQGFCDMTAAELRVLVALMENGGRLPSAEALAKAAGTTAPRCMSALTLLSEMGLIKEETCDEVEDMPEKTEEQTAPTVTEEFEYRLRKGEIDETPATQVATTIRNEHLADMYTECARLFGKPSLPTDHTKMLEALHTQYGLSPEYILTLASYMATKGTPNVSQLKNKAIRLYDKGIDNIEELERYIEDNERENTDVWELKRLLGIKSRKLSEAELEYVRRWYDEFGFSTEIIGEAYSISTIGTSRLSMPYMDKILSGWHSSGCKTLEECRSQAEKDSASLATAHKEKAKRARPKTEAPKPRYGSFDVDEAFKAALSRSFGDDEKTSDK